MAGRDPRTFAQMTDVSECHPCTWNAVLDELPPRERIVVHDGWRLAHAFNTSLRGWLVLVPLRHVESFAELSQREAATFAALARESSRALAEAVGCSKTYVVILGEEKGFAHLHAHVVPRMPELTEDLKGTYVFRLLGVSADDCVTEDERDRLALALRARIEPALA
jgi:diadenosine tetraphosphate (Ap4A) HIT family hydrolase